MSLVHMRSRAGRLLEILEMSGDFWLQGTRQRSPSRSPLQKLLSNAVRGGVHAFWVVIHRKVPQVRVRALIVIVDTVTAVCWLHDICSRSTAITNALLVKVQVVANGCTPVPTCFLVT